MPVGPAGRFGEPPLSGLGGQSPDGLSPRRRAASASHTHGGRTQGGAQEGLRPGAADLPAKVRADVSVFVRLCVHACVTPPPPTHPTFYSEILCVQDGRVRVSPLQASESRGAGLPGGQRRPRRAHETRHARSTPATHYGGVATVSTRTHA